MGKLTAFTGLVFALGLACGRIPGAIEPAYQPIAGPSDAAPDTQQTVDAPRVLDRGLPDPDASKLPPPASCQPRDEICNGVDDDCDGKTDEDLAAIPCPDGGSRYCVAGRMSECPRSCQFCVPGSERVCYISYCTYWAVQTCASDGLSFGLCHELKVPAACRAVVDAKKRSRELEQCCLDNGYCCLDEFDIDQDGDRREMLGACDGVQCGP